MAWRSSGERCLDSGGSFGSCSRGSALQLSQKRACIPPFQRRSHFPRKRGVTDPAPCVPVTALLHIAFQASCCQLVFAVISLSYQLMCGGADSMPRMFA